MTQEQSSLTHLTKRFENIESSLQELQRQTVQCFQDKRKNKKSKQSSQAPLNISPFSQKGTGLHIDSWPYNLWNKLKPDYSYEELDRWRPFQSMICLTDGHPEKTLQEGGLELIPGFASISEEYFPATDRKYRHGNQMRSKGQWVSPYHLGLDKEEDIPLYSCVRKIKRIPQNWMEQITNTQLLLPPVKGSTVEEYLKFVKEIVNEHDSLQYEPVQKGDFVFFDIRTPHQNSNANSMDRERSVFYHAFLMAHPCNLKTIESLRERRRKFEHPEDFSSKFKAEQQVLSVDKDLIPLSTLGKYLYHEEEYPIDVNGDNNLNLIREKYGSLLTEAHVKYFQRYGYVVVENLVHTNDCDELLNDLKESSTLVGCPLDEEFTKSQFKSIGGGFGAMVEWYYLKMQQILRMDEKIYATTVKLICNTWCSNNENEFHTPYECPIRNQLNPAKLWLYVDRMNFRRPDSSKFN